MLRQSITKNAVLLGLFAIISTAIIAGTFIGTAPKIKANMREAEAKALLQIMPESTHDNSLLDDSQAVSDSELLGLREPRKLYIAKRAGRRVGVILPVTARDGYTGDIQLIVGIWEDGSIAGVRVLSHRETPGLGDAVDRKKSDWIDGFQSRSLTDPREALWKVKKDGGVFDQFTGATITPRAVTRSVKNALLYFRENQQALPGGSQAGNP